MPKKPSLLAAVAAASVCLLGGGLAVPLTASADETVIVKGHVKSPTGKRIDDVRVAVITPSGAVKYDRTGKTGYYSVKVSGDGQYTLKVSDPGDNDDDNADGEWATEKKKFTIDGQSSVIVNEVLHHGAKVSGRVYKEDGSSAGGGVRVDAIDVETGDVRGTTWTRSSGAYYFRNLQEGPTVIRVDGLVDGQSSRYYSTSSIGTTELASAKVLGLDYGQKFTKRSVTFPPAGKVTGRVTVDGSVPFDTADHENVLVSLLDSSGAVVSTLSATPTFKFRDLDAGTYYLSFAEQSYDPDWLVDEFYADSTSLASAKPFTIDEGTFVTGLVANLATERPAPTAPLATTISTKESAHSVVQGAEYRNTVTVETYGDTTGGRLEVRVNGTVTQRIVLTDENAVTVTVPTADLTAGTQRVDFAYTPTASTPSASTSAVSATTYFIVK